MNKVENLNKKEISLQDLLPNDFYICDGKMVCNISLEKVNAITEIITNLQQELTKYKERNEKAIEYIETHKRKDEFLELNEWQTRDLLEMLEDKEKK